ncbi:hypothetical protein ACRPFF_08255 [Neisseria sp. SLRRB23]|uniref:hypothetical protein n=1 Tax=Neisseria sp. SLRRB23 TaxID=3435199 RepID=UPI003D7FD97A
MLSIALYFVALIALFASLVMIVADLSGWTDFGFIAYIPAVALIFLLGLVMLVRFTCGIKGYRNVRNEDV